MSGKNHPDRGVLIRLADGDRDAVRDFGEHVRACEECASMLARLRGLITAMTEELGSRANCPSTDSLSTIPVGGEADYPHLARCPLCVEELEYIRERELEAAGTADGEGKLFFPPSPIATRMPTYASGADDMEVHLDAGAKTTGTLGGVVIEVRIEGDVIVVKVEGDPQTGLALILEDRAIERTVSLQAGETRLQRGRWLKGRVVRASSEGTGDS